MLEFLLYFKSTAMFSSKLNCIERCSVIYTRDFKNFPKKESLLYLCLLFDHKRKTWCMYIYVHKHILQTNSKRLTSNALRLFNHMHYNVIMHAHLFIWKENTKKLNNYTTRLRELLFSTQIFFLYGSRKYEKPGENL